MQKLLLTGATGFIGRRVVPFLIERDYEVHAVTSAEPPDSSDRVIWHRCDLLNDDEVSRLAGGVRPSHLLHLAWYVKPGSFWNARENLEWLRASSRLIERFAGCGGERIVTAGTCAEYSWTTAGKLNEDASKMDPSTLYGAAKYALHLTASRFAEISGVSLATGRIFFPFGPGEARERFIPSVIGAFLKGEETRMSHGEQVRDFMHVDDIARAFAALIDSDVTGAVNIGSGVGVSLRDVAERIARIMNCIELLRVGDLPARDNEPAEIVADISRLRDEVGFRGETDLNVPLNSTVEWWRENI